MLKTIYRIVFLMEESAMKNSEKANKRLDHSGFTFRLLLGVAAICMVTLGSALTASADDRPIALTESGVVIGLSVDGVN